MDHININLYTNPDTIEIRRLNKLWVDAIRNLPIEVLKNTFKLSDKMIASVRAIPSQDVHKLTDTNQLLVCVRKDILWQLLKP